MSDINQKYDHAIVAGGSIAGLLAAAAAAPYFKRVTIVERDVFVDNAEPRKGAPQGTQIHGLLPIGMARISRLIPQFKQDLIDMGGVELDRQANIMNAKSVGWTVRTHGEKWITASRPMLELVIRRRVCAMPNVTVVHGSVSGLDVKKEGQTSYVSGVRLRNGTNIEADFVINATGRRTKAVDWLNEHGVDSPRESFVFNYLCYVTQHVRIPSDLLKNGVQGFTSLPRPGQQKGVSVFPYHDGIHALAAIGAGTDHPSTEPSELAAFLRDGPVPFSEDILQKSELVGEPVRYAIDGTLVRHWHEIKNLPMRYLSLGDSVISADPAYGQGMSLSAIGACHLADQLSDEANLDDVARLVAAKFMPTVNMAFKFLGDSDSELDGAHWSDDYLPMTHQEKEDDLALAVLSTQRPEVALAISEAYSNFRLDELKTPYIRSLIDEWLAGPRVVPKFVAANYPRTVTIGPRSPIQMDEAPLKVPAE